MLEHIGGKCIEKLLMLGKLIPQAGAGGYTLPAAIPGGSVCTVGHMVAVLASVQHDQVVEAHIFQGILKLTGVRSHYCHHSCVNAICRNMCPIATPGHCLPGG